MILSALLLAKDCDPPNQANGCGLNCKFLGTSAPNCGNGVIDAGEACDTADPNTKIGCSQNCLRLGSSKIFTWPMICRFNENKIRSHLC